VEPEMCGYAGYNWSHWNGNGKIKEKSGSYTGETFDIFTTADSCTGNSTHNTESAAVWNWSVGGGGHRWVKGSAGEKWSVTRDNNDNDNNNNNNNNVTLTCECSEQVSFH
jgi:hypothetical protein